MENEQNRLVFLAEDISISQESKLNPIFLSIDVKLCDSILNKNGEGVTDDFIADVVSRANDHVCLPFYADVENLLSEKYERLGHKFNKITKQFGTSMIGSLSDFYSETDENGVTSLYGIIKVPKRDKDIVYRLVDLYEMGHFAVSVELKYDPRERKEVDGGWLIDASENSALTGLCLVWRPACEGAYATDMVAQANDESTEIDSKVEEQETNRGETDSMENEKKLTAEETEEVIQAEEKTETEAEAVAEATEVEAPAETQEAVAEDQKEADPEDNKEDEKDEEDVVAESQEANAEVLEHSVDVHESVENWGSGPVHVIEYRERVIETMEDAEALIAELDQKVTALEEIESKYNALIAEQQEKELAAKRNQIRAFAEKQGLNVQDVAVAEAIENINYEKIAELTMAEVEEEAKEEPKQSVSLASFVDMEVGDGNTYGGLLNRKNK